MNESKIINSDSTEIHVISPKDFTENFFIKIKLFQSDKTSVCTITMDRIGFDQLSYALAEQGLRSSLIYPIENPNFKHRWIEWHYWSKNDVGNFRGDGFWFRIFGYGLHFTNGTPLFSERYGIKKRIKLPFSSFRMGFLKRGKSL